VTYGNTIGGGSSGSLGGSGLGGSGLGGQTTPLHVHVSQAAGGIIDTGLLITLLLSLLGLVVILTVVGVLVIVIVSNRADPDPTGRRPLSVYLFGISFVTLLTAVVGSVAVVASLVSLIGSHGPGVGNAVARGAVLGGLITVVSVAVLVVHLRRGLRFAVADGTAGPSQRIARSYVAAVAFVAVLVLVLSAIAGVYLVFVLVGPGVFGFGVSRTLAGEALIVTGYVAVVAVLIVLTHRNMVSPGLRFLKEPTPWADQSGPAGPAVGYQTPAGGTAAVPPTAPPAASPAPPPATPPGWTASPPPPPSTPPGPNPPESPPPTLPAT